MSRATGNVARGSAGCSFAAWVVLVAACGSNHQGVDAMSDSARDAPSDAALSAIAQQAYVKASDAFPNAFFGKVVALSADGTTLAVGSPEESGIPGNVSGAGAVYVYTRADTTWSQQAFIKMPNIRGDAHFGAVALSADGNTLAVGSWGESSSATGIGGDETNFGAPHAGAVFIYTRAGTTWSQQAYVKASNTRSDADFGDAVALSADGNTLAVGSPGESSAAIGIDGSQAQTGTFGAGAVYVYTRTGTTWSQQAYVKASNTRAYASFGYVSLSADGNTLAVGSDRETSAATGINGNQADTSAGNAGAVYVYVRAGTTWSQQAYVKASNARAGASFGYVSLSADGSTLAVGSRTESSAATGISGNQADNTANNAGAVYVYTRAGTTWSQQAYVKASNTRADAFFGSVALSTDGNTLAVGSPGESSASIGIGGNQSDTSAAFAGAVYVYTRAGTIWSQLAYVKASNARASAGFGPVALSTDGITLAVGSLGESSAATGIGGDQADTSAPGAGAVYVFR